MGMQEKGFSFVEVLVLLVVLGLVGFAGYTAWNKSNDSSTNQQESSTQTDAGLVCYDEEKSLYCYDIAKKEHKLLENTQIPDIEGSKYIIPTKDASKYLVILEEYDANATQAKEISVSYYVADSKLQNLQKLNNLERLYNRAVVWNNDNSGFYFTGPDEAYQDDTTYADYPVQIMFYNLETQTAEQLTKSPKNTSYSNPVLSDDGKYLILLQPLDTSETAVVTFQTESAELRTVGTLAPGYAWDRLYFDSSTNSILVDGDAETQDLLIPTANIISGNLEATSVPMGEAENIFGVLKNQYVFYSYDSESQEQAGFTFIDRKSNEATDIDFVNKKGNLVFLLNNVNAPLVK